MNSTTTIISKPNSQRPPRNSRRNARRAVEVVTVKTAPVQPPSQPMEKKRRNKRNKPNRLKNAGRKAVQAFIDAMVYPDLVGPVKLPASGASDRSVVGMDHTSVALAGSATLTHNLYFMNNNFTNAGYISTSTASNIEFSSPTIVANGIQFPTTSQCEELYPTTGCICLQFTGPDNTDGGEILIGCYNSQSGFTATGFTWNILRYQPGWQVFSVAELRRKGLMRIPMQHTEPESFNYIPAGNSFPGMLVPVVITRNMTVGGSIAVEQFRNFEAHSSLSASAIPYESSDGGFSKDVAAFQDALAELSEVPLPYTTGWPNNIRDLVPEWSTVKSWAKKGAELAIPFIVNSLLGTRLVRVQANSGIPKEMTIEDNKIMKRVLELRKKEQEDLALQPKGGKAEVPLKEDEDKTIERAVQDIEDELYKLLTPRSRTAAKGGRAT